METTKVVSLLVWMQMAALRRVKPPPGGGDALNEQGPKITGVVLQLLGGIYP